MKKYLFILATAAIVASCSDNDTFKDVNIEENESPISFTTLSEKITRGQAENSTATQTVGLATHHDNFSIWGFKYGKYGDNNANAWANVWGRGSGNIATGTVSTTDNGATWAASPLKFWDKSADKYYFYAAAPASDKWVLHDGAANTDEDDFYLTYANYVLTGTNAISTATTSYSETFKPTTGTNEDLLIAENKQVDKSTDTYNKTPAATVQLLFDHILSRLNITVKKSSSLSSVTVDITGFTITTGNLCNKGSFDESAAASATLQAGSIARWASASSPSIDQPYTLGAGATIDNLTTTPTYIGQYLIIPQAITSEIIDRADPTGATHPYFRIDYELNDEPYFAYYNLANAFGVAENSTLAFNEGFQNTLNITINADAIVFEPLVYQWANSNTTGNYTVQ